MLNQRFGRNAKMPAVNVSKTKPRNITCIFCHHEFSQRGWYLPLLLSCGHTVCKRCVQSQRRDSCRLCGPLVRAASMDNLPPVNTCIVGLLQVAELQPLYGVEPDISFPQALMTKTKKKSFHQEHCFECAMQASVRCHECSLYYCHICSDKVHGNLKTFSNHRIVQVSNSKKKSIFGANFCDKHSVVIDYYCEDCCSASCHHCMLLYHQCHNVVSLADKNEILLGEFQLVRAKLNETLMRNYQTQKQIQKELNCPKHLQKSEPIEAAINKHFTHLHGILLNTERLLIDKLEEQRNHVISSLSEFQQRLKLEQEQLQSVVAISGNIRDYINRIDLENVIPKLRELADSPCFLVQDSLLDLEEIVFTPDESIKSAIWNHCALSIPKMHGYSLLPENSLPTGYEPEPLNSEKSRSSLDISSCSRTSKLKRASSCQSLFSRRPDNTTLREGCVVLVKACYIEHPSNFYVRPVSHEAKITGMENKLVEHCDQSTEIPDDISQNPLWAVKHELSDEWYRGRVNGINADSEDPGTYEVFDIDNGSVEYNVPKERMRSMPPSVLSIQSTLLKCCLDDIVPKNGKWTKEANEAMADYAGPDEVMMMHIIKVQGNTYYVDFRKEYSRNKASLRDTLIYLDHGSLNNASQLLRSTPRAVQRYYREEMTLNAYYDVTVTHVESPEIIYVQKRGEDSHYLNNMMDVMCKHYDEMVKSEDGIIHVPELGLACAVENEDHTWSRGSIKNLLGSRMVEVAHVDSGKTTSVKYEKIRTLHEKYITWPAQAIRVRLADVKPTEDQWSEQATASLSQLFANNATRAFVFEGNQDCYTVALFAPPEVNVAALLVADGFATSTGVRSSGATEPRIIPSDVNGGRAKVCNLLTAAKTKKNKRIASVKRSGAKIPEDPFKLPIKVVRVVSPDTIYIADPSNEPAYSRMTKKMQRFYKKRESALNSNELRVGAQCAVFSDHDRQFCRGKIVALKNPDEAEVFLYDLSFTETIPVVAIQALDNQFRSTATYVFKVKLAGIYPCGGVSVWTSAASDRLKEVVSECKNGHFWISKMGNIDMDNFYVDLWMEQVKFDGPLAPSRIEINSVNEMLVQSGVALSIKNFYDQKTKLLAAELKRQIFHACDEKVTQAGSELTNGKFMRKKRIENGGSINNGNSEEQSVESDNSSVDDEESMNDATMGQSSDTLTDGNSGMPADPAPSGRKVSEWPPAVPIMEDKFTAIPTNLDHDCRLYLHSTQQSGNMLHHIEQKLAEEYTDMEVQLDDLIWEEGELCIAQYHANKKWYRAQVRRVLDNETIEVYFVDYGNVEICENGTLRKHLILTDVPRQGTSVAIHGLSPDTMNVDENERTDYLDRIHALLVDRECDIFVLDRHPDYLIANVIVTNPKRRELTSYLRNDLHMRILPNPTSTCESSFDESDEILTDDDDVIIDEVITMSEGDLDDESNDNNNTEKAAKVVENGSKNEEDKLETGQDDSLNENNVEDCAIDKNHVEGEENENNVEDESDDPAYEPRDSVSDDYFEGMILARDEIIGAEYPEFIKNDRIITGTANFTCNADEIEIHEREENEGLDCISLADTISLMEADVVASTPQNVSFEAGVQWEYVEIPDDVQVVKAHVSKISAREIAMHVLDNENCETLTVQRQRYEETMREIQADAENQPILKILKRGTPCCAKFDDNKWYRGEVLKCTSKNYELGHDISILFVDFGNEATIKSNELRVLKEEWIEAPRMAIRCKPWRVELAPTIHRKVVKNALTNVYRDDPLTGEPSEFYVKIMNRRGPYFDVEIFRDKKCTELAYEPMIEQGLYIVPEEL